MVRIPWRPLLCANHSVWVPRRCLVCVSLASFPQPLHLAMCYKFYNLSPCFSIGQSSWPSAVVTDEKVIETCLTNLHAFSTQVCEDFMSWELFSLNIIILHFNMSPSRHIYRPIIILYGITEYYVASQLHFWFLISFLSYIINPQIGFYTFNPSTCIFLPFNTN